MAAGSPFRTTEDALFNEELANFHDECGLSTIDKIQSFPVFARRQDLAKLLCRYEIFKEAVEIHGSVLELGVFLGSGLLSFAKFSAILEPVNNSRRFFGFDTFAGFPKTSRQDRPSGFKSKQQRKASANAFGIAGFEFVTRATELFDQNRFLPQVPKVELIRGDAAKTVPGFLKKHPELVIALLYIDINLYEPLRKTLPLLWERIPKGGIIAFDELNAPQYPGETLAVVESVGLGNLRLKRGPFSSYVSYAVKE